MAVDVVFGLLFKMVFMAAVGFYLRRKGLINDDFQKRLSGILLQVVMPLNILAAGHQPFDAAIAMRLLWVVVFALGYHVVMYLGTYFFTRKTSLPEGNKNLYVSMISLGNVAFMGIPVMQELFGDEGVLYSVVFSIIFNLFAFLPGVRLLGGKTPVSSVLKTPMILSCAAAAVFFFSPLHLPKVVVDSCAQVGSMVTPLAMFIIGASLARIRFASIFTDKWAWIMTVVRQVAVPLLLALGMRAAGLRGIFPESMLVLAGMPSATTNVIFAEEYEKDVGFATRGVILSTLFTPVALLLHLWLNSLLFAAA